MILVSSSAAHTPNQSLCGVLQSVAVCCSVLRCVTVCCSVLQHLNTWACHESSLLLCRSYSQQNSLQCVAERCNVLQCVVVFCSVLQRVTTWACDRSILRILLLYHLHRFVSLHPFRYRSMGLTLTLLLLQTFYC